MNFSRLRIDNVRENSTSDGGVFSKFAKTNSNMRYLLLLLFSTPIFAQANYPQGYFRPPLDIPMQLAGNFGELRNNHFHAGFDFRTQQKEGFPVFASADGYVSRIKISPYGYGKAIYIDHPNGYTTVYGHLQNGYGKIGKYIKDEQYKQQLYEIEVFPKPGEIPVKKGDTIAFSGNTGGSEGPHLHFEFRETITEKIINPALFGFDIKDTRRPNVTSVFAYPIGDSSVVNTSARPVIIGLTLQPDGTYVSEKVYAQGKIGFGIVATDQDDVSYSNNGVYKVEGYNNGAPSFGITFDTFAFDEARYINAYIDYPHYKQTRQRIQRLFMPQRYGLSIISTTPDNGIVNVRPNFSQTYRIEASDFSGNKTTIMIPVDYSPNAAKIPSVITKTNYRIRADKDASFEKGNFSVFFPADTFYEDFYLNFDATEEMMTLQDDRTPVHANFSVSVRSSDTSNTEKTFIASISGKRLEYNATKYRNGAYVTWTRNLGQFRLAKDTIAPTIVPVKPIKDKWLTKNTSIALKIGDNLSGIKSYSGYLNGKWALFEYDYKARRITHIFDAALLLEGRNELKVTVSDNVGNSAIFETQFFRSQQK